MLWSVPELQTSSLDHNAPMHQPSASMLDSSKGMGINGIGPGILKYCAPALYVPLCHLFNLSLSSHTLPSEWCVHLIAPIHKSSDKH